ncbi:hypothetical protein [Stetteria hydrogenophila]
MLLNRYPFTVSLKSYSRAVAGVELGVESLARDEAIRRLALRRFRAGMEGSEYKPSPDATVDDEVFSFHLALALAAAVGPAALKRFAEAEASRARRAFSLEGEATLLELASKLGVKVEMGRQSLAWLVSPRGDVRRRILTYRVHVSDFLRVHAESERDDALSNSFLLGGWVYLDRQGLEELLYDAVKLRIERLAGELDYSELPGEVVARARAIFEEALDSRSRRLLDLKPEAFPPCVNAIVEKASREGLRSLTDEEGYTLATFLAYTRVDPDAVKKLLGADDRDAIALVSLARYARSRGFRPLKCSAAREVGVCRWECRGPTPLAEYRRLLRSSPGGPRGPG